MQQLGNQGRRHGFQQEKKIRYLSCFEANNVQALDSGPTRISLQAAKFAAESYTGISCLLCFTGKHRSQFTVMSLMHFSQN